MVKCDACNNEISENDFNNHKINCWEELRDYYCKCCRNTRKLLSFNVFQLHKKSCEEQFLESFGEPKQLTQEEKYNEFVRNYDPNIEEGNLNNGTSAKCFYCSRIVPKKILFNEHLPICKLKNPKPKKILGDITNTSQNQKSDDVRCEHCSFTGTSRYMNYHYRAVHKLEYKPKEKKKEKSLEDIAKGKPVIKCDLCDKTFIGKYIYEHYSKVHNKKFKIKKFKDKTADANEKSENNLPASAKAKDATFTCTFSKACKHSLRKIILGIYPVTKVCLKVIKRKVFTLIHSYKMDGRWIYQYHRHIGKIIVFRLKTALISPRKFSRTAFNGSREVNRKRFHVKHGMVNVSKGRKHVGSGDTLLKVHLAKTYVCCNEKGAFADNFHSHMYCTTPPETTINDLRIFLLRHNRFLQDIQYVRNPKSNIDYCTKEDKQALIHGVDKDYTNIQFQAYQCAIRDIECKENSYQIFKWNSKFRKDKFLSLYTMARNELLIQKTLEKVEHFVNDDLLYELHMDTPKRGIYVYGPPGVGKSSTVFHYTQGQHYQVSFPLNRFSMSSYNNEPYILFEDAPENSLDNTLSECLLNNLADEKGLAVGERKGGSHFLISARRIIVTSNYNPPKFPGFDRRFKVVEVKNNNAFDVLMSSQM